MKRIVSINGKDVLVDLDENTLGINAKELRINKEAGKYLEEDHVTAWLNCKTSTYELYYYFKRHGMKCSYEDFEETLDIIASNFNMEDEEDEMSKMWWKE